MKNQLKTIFQTSIFNRFLIISLVSSVVFTSALVKADDTEIYAVNPLVTPTQPNILFIMDTSGSMSDSPALDPNGPAKIVQMKSALKDLLSTLSGVNVGLMRFTAGKASETTEGGGPILYPVTAIDDVVDPLAESQVNSASDVGWEIVSPPASAGFVSTGHTAVPMVTGFPDNCATCQISVVEVLDDADDIVVSGEPLDPVVGELGKTFLQSSLPLGLRFEVDIPAGSLIKSARIVFTAAPNDGSLKHSEPLKINAQWQNINNPGAFSANENIHDGSGRNYHGDRNWNVPVFVPGTEYAMDVKWSIQYNVQQQQQGAWTAGDHIVYNFERKKTTVPAQCTNFCGQVCVQWCNGETFTPNPTPNYDTEGNRVFPDTTYPLQNRIPVNGNDPLRVMSAASSSFPNPALRNFTGRTSATPPRLEIVWVPKAELKVAIRFDEVRVPQGATITSAFLDFSTHSSGGAANLEIRAHKTTNSPTIAETPLNISGRGLTNNVTIWNNIVGWGGNAADRKTSPDMKNIVQEMVNQAGWCTGNPITFVVNGSGRRVFRTWNADITEKGLMPKLRIRYDDASAVGGCNTKKIVVGIASQNDDVDEESGTTGNPLGQVQHPFTSSSWSINGYRFQNIEVPQGATITNAYMQFTGAGTYGGTPSSMIKAVASDDFPAWTLVNSEVSSQTFVPATKLWTLKPWKNKFIYNTPDISNVVQQVINRAGWLEGNSLAIVTTSTGGGSNHRSYSSSHSRGPQLIIEYSAPFIIGSRTVRDELQALVKDFNAYGTTPISGSLAEAASYYRGESVYYGKNRGFGNHHNRRYFRTSHDNSFLGGARVMPHGCYELSSNVYQCMNEVVNGAPQYVSPIDNVCQTNNILLLSDGIPNTNHASAKAIIDPVILGDGDASDGFPGYPGGCSPALDGKDCSLKLVEALNKEDNSSAYLGDQQIVTHTIGFDLLNGGPAAEFLEDLASNGGGGSYSADNANGLKTVFDTVINSLERQSQTFVSAGVSVNQFNRLTHRDELYFALFSPEGNINWPGNLKRYQLSGGEIKDVNGVPAVNPQGRFQDTARSFWSSVVDGDVVENGGAAEKAAAKPGLTWRKVYSNLTADPLTHVNNTFKTGGTVVPTQIELSVVSNNEQLRTIEWATGLDVAASGSASNRALGDPLHSRPVVATYASGDTVVFVGTNQGFLKATDTTSGSDLWSFIPKSLLANLNLFRTGAIVADHIYGLDGSITLEHNDLDNDLMIDGGETAILYIGMRRGGRNYYAIDISDRLNPTLKFIIQGGVNNALGDYTELGQTWSKLTIGNMKVNGVSKRVMVFGGGYDTNQDNTGVHTNDALGRTVFIADAMTGQLIWNARINNNDPVIGTGTSVINNLNNSIPADIKAIDLSGSGYIEHIYAADTAGQVFRFDINPLNTGAADLITGGRIANLQTGAVVEANNRRFFYAPDVAAIKRPNYKDFIAVSIGSGFRAHPLDKNINDKFYVIRDTWVLDGNKFPNLPGDIDEGDLADVTNTIADGNNDGISDALALIENTANPKNGWFIDFLQTGEKVLAESVTFNEKVIVTTYHPTVAIAAGSCDAPEGQSRAYILNLVDGTPALDNVHNGVLEDLVTGPADTTTCGDRCMEVARGIAPSGLVLFEPSGATICFGTQCFDNVLSFNGPRLQRVKWRRRDN